MSSARVGSELISRKGTKPGAALPGLAPAQPREGVFAEREREALETLGDVPDPPSGGVPDTVKLTNQTWRPPAGKPSGKLKPASWQEGAQATVKVKANTWTEPTSEPEDEDAVTDVRDMVDLEGAHESGSIAVTGEDAPQVAGEIGSVEEPAVRIVSVPPSDAAPTVKLPGLSPGPQPIADEPSVQVEAGTAVESPAISRTPTPLPHTPTPLPHTPTPLPHTPTPLPHASPVPPSAFGHDRLDSTPHTPSHAQRPIDPTMLLRIERRPTRAIAITAVIAGALGLGAGYALWGLGGSEKATPVAAAPTAPAEKAAVEDKVVTPPPAPTCEIEVKSVPAKASVSWANKDGTTNELGLTPLRATVPCEQAEVTVTRRRYVASKEAVAPTPEKPATLEITLERPVHRVTIKSKPKGAEIHLDGEVVGTTPATLDVPGFTRSMFVLKRDGYRDQTAKVSARKKSSSVTYRLKKKR